MSLFRSNLAILAASAAGCLLLWWVANDLPAWLYLLIMLLPIAIVAGVRSDKSLAAAEHRLKRMQAVRTGRRQKYERTAPSPLEPDPADRTPE